jgi:hypothetical protein
VALHLRAETEHESPARVAGEIVAQVGDHHRAARKRNRHGGAEPHALGGGGGEGERNEGVVLDLRRHQAAEAERFGAPRRLGNRSPVVEWNRGVDLHGPISFRRANSG